MKGQTKRKNPGELRERVIRHAKKTGDMYDDLREHLKTYSGSPADDYVVDNIKLHIDEAVRAHKNGDFGIYHKYFRFVWQLLQGLGCSPKTFIEIRRKAQLEDSYNPDYAEKKRKELIKGNDEEIDL